MINRILVLFVLLSLISFSLSAQSKKASDSTKIKKVEDVIEGKKAIEGLFILYQDTTDGSLQMLVKKDQLENEFIYQSFSMGGPPALFLNQNMLRNTWVFSIEKSYKKLCFKKENTAFYYNPDKAITKAANVDVSRANFYTTDIVAQDDSSYLIKVDKLFFGQLMDPIKQLFQRPDPKSRRFNLGSIDKTKSTYLKLRSFPENTDVVVSLSFDNSKPSSPGTNHVTDERYVEVKMQHSFIEMPKNNYRPRFDDPRVGYFMEQVSDVTTYDYPNYYDKIHRWNLEKKNPDAALSEPVKPITWWVENTTPVEYRQIILEAGRKWNMAFEKAGFKNAVVMKMMPDDADWDPADIRYNVIRWVASDLGFAIGPSFVNPRTGEILGADITIDFGMLLFTLNEQSLSDVGFQAYDYGLDHDLASHNYHSCSMAKGKRAEQGLAHAMVASAGASDAELKKLTEQFMTELVLHEMGHTMGLAHNMKASQMLNLEDLHNTDITRKIGITASIMDYTIANVHSDPSKQGDYYSVVPGPYDLWAIQYGYTPFDKEAEKEGLAAILKMSSDPKLDFGNDADITDAFSGVDPRVLTWDLSKDVVEYAEDRYAGINMRVGKLRESFVEDDASYQKLNFMYFMMQRGRSSMSRAVSRYIGGIYVNRTFPGQESAQLPYTPVPEAYQRRAMNFLKDNVFAPNAFDADAELYPYLQRQRRGWNFGGSTEDPKIQSLIYGLQYNALSFLMHYNTMHRINNTTLYGNTYTVDEMLNDLVAACFEADWKEDVNLFRQNLQSGMVDQLINAALDKSNKYDNASSSAALAALEGLSKKLKKKKGTKDLSSAHRLRLYQKIEKVLDV